MRTMIAVVINSSWPVVEPKSQSLGSARASLVGFGISPKRTFFVLVESLRRGRCKQHARCVRSLEFIVRVAS